MDDEEAKRIQEERDKQLTEEYKDVTNPKKPTSGFHPYGQFVEAAFPESNRDIVPLTYKDGTTTYHYRGNEYLTEEEAIAARDGPAWGKKAVEFAGKTLMSSPTINTIVNKAGPIVGKALGNKTVQDAMTMPGEDTIVPLVGDSFVQYGFPRIAGEGLGYGIYPGPENPTKFDPGNVEKIFNATRKGDSLIDAGTGAVIRNNDGIIDNSVFKITGGGNQIPIQRFMTNKYKREVRGLMSKYGMGDGVFRMDVYDKAKGAYTENVNRFFLERFLSPDSLKGSFTGFKNAQKGSFQRLWGEFLEAKGLDPTLDIQAHHINALYDSIHLYDGIKWNSPEYWDLTATLLNRNARPGVIQRGDDINNLIMTMGKAVDPDTPHGIAHKFYNNFTPDFFNADEMRKIRDVPGYRDKKAERWSTLVNKSEEVLLEAHRVWIALNPKIDLEFDELIERMTQYNELGYKKLIDPKYQLPDIPRIVKEVIDDYDAGNVPSALTGKSQSPPIQVPQVKSISPKQQSLDKLKELREELRDNKKKYNKDEIAQMEADIKKLADELEGKQKNIFDKTGL